MNQFHIAGMIVGVVGLALVAWFAGGWAALGLFLFMFGNNLQREGDRFKRAGSQP